LAISAAAPDCRAADVYFINGGDFNTAENWTDGMPPSTDLDNHFIQDGLTATYSAGTLTLRKLVVSDSSPGTLNMTGGDLTLGGGGDSFQIGRGLFGDGLVDLSGTAILRTTDNSAVGERDNGVLHIGPNAQVLSPGTYWRVGNFGPSVDAGFLGEGLLDVEGTFNSHAMFIGVQDATGVLQVRGSGSVTLTDVIEDFNHNPVFHPNQSGTIHMIGSNASLSALDLLWDHDAASPVKNLAWFTADSGGVSPITLADEVNINNNELRVDLTGFAVAPGAEILLFDAAPNRITGTFGAVDILGANPANYVVAYDQPTGNILLRNTVPEPSTAILLGLGAFMAISARRHR
jgi:hypothetical protein